MFHILLLVQAQFCPQENNAICYFSLKKSKKKKKMALPFDIIS